MGCFAIGCLTILVVGFILIAGVIGGTWYLCHKAADTLTSSEPVDLRIVPPDDAQVRAAERSVARVKTAIATSQERAVIFTAADLNALVARDPDFRGVRDRIRIDIAHSLMTITMSTPLDDIPWVRLEGRWFNASATFGFAYALGMFRVDLRSAEAEGHHLSDKFLSSFSSSFNQSFNRSFQDQLRGDNRTEFWNHVKTMSLEGDRLVVITNDE